MYQVDDWRDPTRYPDPGKGTVPLGVWVWEFVRRNPSFRRDFDALIRPVWQELSRAKAITGYEGVWQHEAAVEAWKSLPERAVEIFLEEENPPITLQFWLAPHNICEQSRWKFWKIALNEASVPLVGRPETRSVFSKKLKTYRSPTEFIGASPEFIFCHAGHTNPALNIPVRPSERNRVAWVKLDLHRPLKAQMNAISVWARDVQKVVLKGRRSKLKSPKPRFSRFALFLRILDAVETKATHGEIAAFFFPKLKNDYPHLRGNKRVENTLVAARLMRDRGWRDLLGT